MQHREHCCGGQGHSLAWLAAILECKINGAIRLASVSHQANSRQYLHSILYWAVSS